MHLLKISIALTLSVVCVALPQPQQYSFGPVHSSNNNNNNNNNQLINKQDYSDYEYARFDNEQVVRVEVSTLEQLKQLEATVE
ncbi:hypothetical protein BGZ76_010139, partial [Entomortierella beljakovae]